ncbi:DUF2786 domain-containing protein [Corynebacterium guangdongense]|uniref:DUF2786 domain-containing protein n=1 Tax=Corynebacterium guangdongense TaxID=1783348 RepID=A0ABU1ZY00_9CORY|nr:DUF2786 domain-containing protein [Corynebacterium guangdongense]MDR7329812.1 hypothetical protein [Corynebacterium guangdongense]WJZ18375.1 hypothetical protein CGUA_09070 [Corynebacterium guangdongense]
MNNDLLQATVNAARLQILDAGARGWLPDDLRHVLSTGPGLDHLLHTAADLITFLPGPVAERWRRQSRRGGRPPRDMSLLRTWIVELRQLTDIPGADTVLRTDEEALAGLDEPQLKAHQRVQALLAKAESTTYEEEAKALLEKAAQLRQRYRLAEILDELTSGEGPTIATARIHLRAPWVPHQAQLLGAVAQPNGCRAILFHRKGLALIVGETADVRHVTATFASVNRQRDWFMRNSPGARAARKFDETSAYRRSFQLSYATEIGRLLRDAATVPQDAHRGAREEAAGKDALPALTHREVAVADAFNRMFPRRSSMNLSSRHPGGHADGRDAAHNSKLGPDQEAGLRGRRALSR